MAHIQLLRALQKATPSSAYLQSVAHPWLGSWPDLRETAADSYSKRFSSQQEQLFEDVEISLAEAVSLLKTADTPPDGVFQCIAPTYCILANLLYFCSSLPSASACACCVCWKSTRSPWS
jgi:hypothetical protein